MAGSYRKIESPQERARRIARQNRMKKTKNKKRKLRFKKPERARKERRAKSKKIKGIGEEGRELIQNGLCPTCRKPAAKLKWHHVLPRALFPELIFDPENAFMGCEDPECGHSLDRDASTGKPLSLRERVSRILKLLGFKQALYARRHCRGRVLDKIDIKRVG